MNFHLNLVSLNLLKFHMCKNSRPSGDPFFFKVSDQLLSHVRLFVTP